MVGHHRRLGPVQDALETRGFARLHAVFRGDEVDALRASLASALRTDSPWILRRHEQPYAARNLAVLWPDVRRIEHRLRSATPLVEVVGSSCRLVRALFFDKPPGHSWPLPWHRDTALALASPPETKVTWLAGVPHIQGSAEVLSSMLTARLHLDLADETNGALRVVPGSHRADSTRADGDICVAASAGDVLLMRPRLLHKSDRAQASASPRRVVHLEFAASDTPGPGLEWADPYRPGGKAQ